MSGPIAYAELAAKLGVPVGGRAPLAEVRDAVLELRRGKGMVVDPADPDSVSAGSFFTNPILDTTEFAALQARARTAPPAWPSHVDAANHSNCPDDQPPRRCPRTRCPSAPSSVSTRDVTLKVPP